MSVREEDYLFPPSVLNGALHKCSTTFLKWPQLKEVTSNNSNLVFRPLHTMDYEKNFLKLISEEEELPTSANEQETFSDYFDTLSKMPNTYYTVVVEETVRYDN